ncbi:MAG: TM0106 family RecB-like putative nuclease [Isosphaeraceae bacterium]
MAKTITSDLVEAYSLCPRKAFLLMTGATADPGPHGYELLIREQAEANRQAYRVRLAKAGEVVPFGGPAEMAAGREIVADADLTADGLHARCDFLMKVTEPSRFGKFSYEPVKVIGTCRASRPDTLGLAYQGLALGELQGRQPSSGTLVLFGNRPGKVILAGNYKEVRRTVDALRAWAGNPAGDAPPVVLNKHCPSCPFRDACLQQAEREDNLSLLDRMTPKLMRKYHDKGIFTIRQLSHIYKPRRSKKKARRQVRHSLELQALAIRTGKIHVEHLPELTRGSLELFVDLEGIPARDTYYLAGLLISKASGAEYQPFWADEDAGESAMWSALVERLEAYPDAPIYHYGSYEKKAFAKLARRHGRGSGLVDRLVNVASSVYGKVDFPIRSNGLKQLGRFLGATWSDPQASGLQSLVWRHNWEARPDERLMQSLLRYNLEDCEAVRMLVDQLARIRQDATSNPAIDFAHRPKQSATKLGREAHLQFERILREAAEDGRRRSVRVRPGDTEVEGEPKKRGAREGHQAYLRIVPTKANRTVRVAPKRKCPKGHGALILEDHWLAAKILTDLAFTRNGCRKLVTRYEGKIASCPKCKRYYEPPAIVRLRDQTFGHAFQAWSVYQRIVLRLPYRVIAQMTEHLFGVGVSASSGVNFLRYLADY